MCICRTEDRAAPWCAETLKLGVCLPDFEPNLESFTIGKRIGRRGFSEIYLADSRDGLRAIEIFPRAISDRRDFIANFERRTLILKTLNHPNIARVFERGYENGAYYLVHEYAGGESLDVIMRRGASLDAVGNGRRALPVAKAKNVAIQVLEALRYAHKRGVVHGCVRPECVFTGERGQIKITGFSVCGFLDFADYETLIGADAAAELLAHMAPELKTAGARLCPQADSYSVGLLFARMLTGESPRPGRRVEIVRVRPEVSRDVEEIVNGLLEIDPQKRLLGYEDVLERLNREDAVTLCRRRAGGTVPDAGTAGGEAAGESIREPVAELPRIGTGDKIIVLSVITAALFLFGLIVFGAWHAYRIVRKDAASSPEKTAVRETTSPPLPPVTEKPVREKAPEVPKPIIDPASRAADDELAEYMRAHVAEVGKDRPDYAGLRRMWLAVDTAANAVLRGKVEDRLRELESGRFIWRDAEGRVATRADVRPVDGVYVPHGEWKDFNSSGRIVAEGRAANGQRAGEWKFYWASGELKGTGTYTDGKPDGAWVEYRTDGRKLSLIEYRKGDTASVIRFQYYPDGGLSSKTAYAGEERHGYFEEYYENGRVRHSGNYKNGKMHGEFSYFDIDGKRLSKKEYAEGVKHGSERHWDDKGRQVAEFRYENGKMILKRADDDAVDFDEIDVSGLEGLIDKYMSENDTLMASLAASKILERSPLLPERRDERALVKKIVAVYLVRENYRRARNILWRAVMSYGDREFRKGLVCMLLKSGRYHEAAAQIEELYREEGGVDHLVWISGLKERKRQTETAGIVLDRMDCFVSELLRKNEGAKNGATKK